MPCHRNTNDRVRIRMPHISVSTRRFALLFLCVFGDDTPSWWRFSSPGSFITSFFFFVSVCVQWLPNLNVVRNVIRLDCTRRPVWMCFLYYMCVLWTSKWPKEIDDACSFRVAVANKKMILVTGKRSGNTHPWCVYILIWIYIHIIFRYIHIIQRL